MICILHGEMRLGENMLGSLYQEVLKRVRTFKPFLTCFCSFLTLFSSSYIFAALVRYQKCQSDDCQNGKGNECTIRWMFRFECSY